MVRGGWLQGSPHSRKCEIAETRWPGQITGIRLSTLRTVLDAFVRPCSFTVNDLQPGAEAGVYTSAFHQVCYQVATQ